MANVALSSKAVGDIVKLNVDGAAKDFIVVHQGKPGTMYDDSCNGTWLLLKDCLEQRQWHNSNVNDYANSDIHKYLNDTWLKKLDSKIQAQVKQVKIPYRPSSGTGTGINSGASGLSCKIFLLSGPEVHYTHTYMVASEGAALKYFENCATTAADSKRVANYNGSAATLWWLRSPYTNNASNAWSVVTDGGFSGRGCSNSYGVRPALVLPSSLLVSDSGEVKTNTPPTISSTTGTSGVNLGSKNAAFTVNYTPTDADGGSLTVTEYLDNVQQRQFTASSGAAQTFQCVSTAENFQRVTNGTHTLKVTVSDGEETATWTATFEKAVYAASITLTTPLAVEGDISAAILGVTGSIPVDANYKVEATNNAKDSAPVWQDVTAEVKSGANIVFTNKTAANGAAFNFKITVSRGSSNTGGYIAGVNGAFQ